MNARIIGAASLALSLFAAVPAAAQANGIGVADPAVAVAGSQALQTAVGQIGTTFQAQRTQIEQLNQQRATLMRGFDTNNDGQLSQEEQTAAQANTQLIAQIQGVETQINTVQEPITLAGIYVVEQLGQQLSTAVEQVVQANSLQLLLSPGATLWISDAVEMTDDIIARLNANVPTVSTAVPQGWQPAQSSVQLFQQVQDIRRAVAQQQAAAAQQPAAATPVQGR
jgi:Skp family chaperone for outer membrane proteins